MIYIYMSVYWHKFVTLLNYKGGKRALKWDLSSYICIYSTCIIYVDRERERRATKEARERKSKLIFWDWIIESSTHDS